jgi:hypothetical protein
VDRNAYLIDLGTGTTGVTISHVTPHRPDAARRDLREQRRRTHRLVLRAARLPVELDPRVPRERRARSTTTSSSTPAAGAAVTSGGHRRRHLLHLPHRHRHLQQPHPPHARPRQQRLRRQGAQVQRHPDLRQHHRGELLHRAAVRERRRRGDLRELSRGRRLDPQVRRRAGRRRARRELRDPPQLLHAHLLHRGTAERPGGPPQPLRLLPGRRRRQPRQHLRRRRVAGHPRPDRVPQQQREEPRTRRVLVRADLQRGGVLQQPRHHQHHRHPAHRGALRLQARRQQRRATPPTSPRSPSATTSSR